MIKSFELPCSDDVSVLLNYAQSIIGKSALDFVKECDGYDPTPNCVGPTLLVRGNTVKKFADMLNSVLVKLMKEGLLNNDLSKFTEASYFSMLAVKIVPGIDKVATSLMGKQDF